MHRKLCKCVSRYFSPIYKSRSNFRVVKKWVMGPSWWRYLFFFDLLIRACTGSFANLWTGTNLENIKLGQIFGSSKNRSWALVDACNFFFVGHELEHAQEALDICQNAKTLKTPHKVWLYSKNVNCRFVTDGILGNLLMTLIDLVN